MTSRRPWKQLRRLEEACLRSHRILDDVVVVREGAEDFSFCDGFLVEYVRWPECRLAPNQETPAFAPPRRPNRYVCAEEVEA